MFHHMCHHRHRRHHTFLHLMAWLGAFLLGWEVGKQGFRMPGFNGGDGFINYPHSDFGGEHSATSADTSNRSESQSFEPKPEGPLSSVNLAEETNGPSEQYL